MSSVGTSLPVYHTNFSKTLKLLEKENTACSNQDAEEFCDRIKTFVDQQKWVGKPPTLSPPVCARYGWKCIGPNLLQCVSCSARLCTSLPPMEKCDTYNVCLTEVIKSLKSSHIKHCPWPFAPSPDSYCKMVSVCKEVVFQDFVSRLESLLPIRSLLPLIRPEAMEIAAISDDDFRALCKLSHIPTDSFSKCAILIAATGWKRKSDVCEKKFIICQNCQRTVGLWFYAQLGRNPEDDCSQEIGENPCDSKTGSNLNGNVKNDFENSADDVEIRSLKTVICPDLEPQNSLSGSELQCDSENCAPCDGRSPTKKLSLSVSENMQNHKIHELQSSKNENRFQHEMQLKSEFQHNCSTIEGSPTKKVKENKDPFDPFYEHRPWCLWVNKTDCISRNRESVPGWKMYLTSLLKNIENDVLSPYEVHSPTKEELNSARELLKTWSNSL